MPEPNASALPAPSFMKALLVIFPIVFSISIHMNAIIKVAWSAFRRPF